MKKLGLKFPKETKSNVLLCDKAFDLVCASNIEEGLGAYREAADNGSARGAFMTAALCYMNDLDNEAKRYFEIASSRGYPFACGYLLEIQNDSLGDYDILNYAKRCVCYYPRFFGKKKTLKTIVDKELDSLNIRHLILYCAKEIAVTLFLSNLKYMAKDMFEYAEFGSNNGDCFCSLVLAKSYIDERFVARDRFKAQRYLTLSVEQGLEYQDNKVFRETFRLIERAEREQEKIDRAKSALKKEQATMKSLNRYNSIIGFCDWLGNNVDSLFSSSATNQTSTSGDTVTIYDASGNVVGYKKDGVDYDASWNKTGFTVGNTTYDNNAKSTGFVVGNKEYDSQGKHTSTTIGNAIYDSDGKRVGSRS